jgi:hypothetical protein
MTYYRNRRYAARPKPRGIVVKFAGPCACCGAIIKPGESAMFYPVGTIAGVHVARIAHIGGLDGNSATCSAALRQSLEGQAATNDYAGDGLDQRYEDQCAERCGL